MFGNNATLDFNGPLPKAYSANPGIFLEHTRAVDSQLTIRTGGRFDIVETNASRTAFDVDGIAGPGGGLGPNGEFPFTYNPQGNPVLLPDGFGGFVPVPGIPLDMADILLGDFNQSFALGALYLTGDYKVDDVWSANGGVGFAMRAPTMSELYPYSLTSTVMPQQTYSVMYGNPNLKSEKRFQIDVGMKGDSGRWQFAVNGFSAWVMDYVTFDAIDPGALFFQTTNTDLALLAGAEIAGNVDLNDSLSAFGSMNYTEGRDLDRNSNGLFGLTGNSTRSELTDRDHEPLPNMPPLQVILGLRVKEPGPTSRWRVEFSARIVDDQQRVASSLAELPTPGFTTYDIRGFWQVTQSFSVVAGVENLTDKHYQEHLDPHGRITTPGLFAAGSLGRVFRPGVNVYLGSEWIY